LRLLVFTTLFPRRGAEHHGVFVLERLRHWLAGSTPAAPREALVVAPVPWVPKPLARGRYAEFRDVPEEERLEAIASGGAPLRVLHPRFALVPKVSMSVSPLTLAHAGWNCVKQLLAAGESFDLLDAHYLYPDAVAAAAIARRMKLPFVVTARGTDVTLLPQYAVPRHWLRSMLKRASAGIAVADALRVEMAKLAPPSLELVTLSNGVDLSKFRPLPRDEARARLGWPRDRRIVLAVGHLIRRKGQHHLLAALPLLPPDVDVKLVGDGEERGRLLEQAAALGVADRVQLCGRMPHEALHVAYSAADALALLSEREGWANVLLESLACGTPVVATRVFGTPEVLRDPAIGTLLDATEPRSVASALQELLSRPADRARARAYAEGHSWQRTVDGMQALFERVVARRAAPERGRG
jgi:glycosyltransferase involved in cell wall biosynthesis